MWKFYLKTLVLMLLLTIMSGLTSCRGKTAGVSMSTDTLADAEVHIEEKMIFNSDSAYNYIDKQVKFGPRVPGTPAHEETCSWLAGELQRHGATIELQKADLKAFDGTVLRSTNIIGRFNPEMPERLLLLAHWDTRPWADNDPDPKNHKKPVDGANDGGSGVGVLLEVARALGEKNPGKGIDILFVDSEDYGSSGDDDSWALGARHYAGQLPANHGISQAILLDMVGGEGAKFHREYFSEESAPDLAAEFWDTARLSGYGEYFPAQAGGAINDDHLELIKVGIPAIDIIEYNMSAGTGFNPRWHTISDNMEGISRNTLKAVGQTLLNFIYK